MRSGGWSDTNNWNSGAVGGGAGFTADFSTIDITADRTVLAGHLAQYWHVEIRRHF